MTIDPNRVKEIFLAATDKPDETALAAYLDRACAGDAGLRDRVEMLLRAHDPAGSFLASPAVKSPELSNGETLALDSPALPEAAHEEDEELKFLGKPTRPDSLGRLGHYEVLQVLGKGGFGIVFRAFDNVLQRVVAVKVMAPQIATLSPARKRFLREARSSAAVRHENVVQVYEVGEQPLPYLVMEFIPSETLQQRLNRSGPLDVPEMLRIGRQVAEGLAAAHACDLIHRDIKPGNILLEGGTQRVKITDFGLARAADDASISQSGVIAGTPMFMAPEQALGQPIDQRADLFSLGSVLYLMVSGRPPFRAPSVLAVLKRVAEEPARPIPEIIPETPAWVCDIIAKLHAKNPDERFQSAREVADLLADCEAKLKAKQEVKNVLPASPSAVKPAGRKWVAAAVVLLLPVIALAVIEFAGVTHLLRKQQPNVVVTPKIDPKVDPNTPLATGRFALAFDGENSVVKIPSLKILEDHALTVEAWTVLEQPANQSKSCDLLGNAGFRGGFTLYVPLPLHGGDGNKLAFMTRLTTPDKHVIAWEKQPVPRNQLIHVAGVYDGNAEIRFYVHGQLQSRRPAQDIKLSPTSFLLGNNRAGDGGFLGRMNEVRISKVARYDADFTPDKRWAPDANTLALYRFDEGEGTILKDSSGNGHDGEIVGAKWVKADPKKAESNPEPNYSLAFDGVKTWVQLPLTDDREGSWTIEAWVRCGKLNRLATILAAYSPPRGLGLSVFENQLEAAVSFADEPTWSTAKSGLRLDDGEMQHVAAVYDGRKLKVYLRGKQVAESQMLAPHLPSKVRFCLGGYEGRDLFTGVIDEVRISRTARYVKEFEPKTRFEPDPDTLAMFHCDEGQGDVLTDSSGNGHHGKIVGAKWVKADGSPIGSPPAVPSGPLPPTFKNTIGMEFVIVPKGKSWLGGGKDKLGDKEVVIPADFYMGKYHVTQEEWEKVMEDNPSYFSRKGAGKDEVKDISDADLKRFPVDRVSWEACQIFVARLNKLEKDTGWVYRLPKEVEYEYACRGGPMSDRLDSAFDFYFAKPANAAGMRANLNTGTVENPVMLGRTCKVGSYEPNALGLHDLHGNLAVWCDDAAKTFDEADGYALRGGSWNSPTEYCRAACRLTRLPSNQSQSTGLRLARVPSGAPSPEAK